MREQILSLVVAVLAALVPVVRAYIKTHWTPERMAQVVDIARVAVRAAEKLADDLAEFLPEDTTAGAAKFNYAAEVVAKGARRLGIRLSAKEVTALIQQALDEMERVRSATPAAA